MQSFQGKQSIEVKLNQQELTAFKTETQLKLISSTIITDNSNIKETNAYFTQVNKYLTNREEVCLLTNQHRFKFVVRITAIVKRFINKLKYKVNLWKETLNKESILQISFGYTGLQQLSTHGSNKKHFIFLSDKKIEEAQNYFFKGRNKNFTREIQYKRISKEKDDLLYYTGRILPTQDI